MATIYNTDAINNRVGVLAAQINDLLLGVDSHIANQTRSLAVARILGKVNTPGFQEEFRKFRERV